MSERDSSAPMRSRATLATLGILAAVLGMIVLTGWYGQYPRLVRISPGLVPMAPRSALSFLCFGFGLWALVLGRHRVCMGLAGVVAFNNGLTLIVYSTAMNINLDRTLHLPEGLLPPKAVAPNTAVCFLLLSTALFLMGCERCFRGRPVVLALLGSVTTALSVVSLIGYISSVKTFEWADLAPMAPHTSVGLALLSAGVLAFSWWDERPNESGPPAWLFASATLIAVVFTISLWQALAAAAAVQARKAIAADAAEIRISLIAQMRLRTEALVRAARTWERRGKLAPDEWEFESGFLLSDGVLDFHAVEWVDPDLRIRMVAPRKGNEPLLNVDLSFEPGRRAAFESARKLRQAIVTRTVDLLTGGRGIQIYVPVFKKDACQGFIAGIFLVDELFPSLVPPAVAPGEQIQIFEDDEAIYTRAGVGEVPAWKWSQRATLDLNGPRWTLSITPSAAKLDSLRSSIPETVLWSGLLLAALAGAAIFLAQQAWERARTAEALQKTIEKEAAERRQAEEELNQFFALSLEILCTTGHDGYFKRLNPGCERILGFSIPELLAQPVLNFVHPDDRERTAAEFRLLAGGVPMTSFENRYRRKDGSYRWLHWACAPLPNRPLFFASARDITDRKTAEEALRCAHAELEDRVRERTGALEQTNRALARSKTEVMKLNQQLEKRLRELSVSNQELEAFTYSVSHDLRAPLRHVDGFSKILLEEYGEQLPEEARPLLDRVRQGTQRMGRMVDELLELSRTSRREPTKRLTGLRALVEEVIADLVPEVGDREVEWRIAALPFVDCDPALARQLFVNLLSNSLKFSRTRRKTVIEVGQTEVAGEPVLFVRDNGVGFSMKYADKLFGAFQRLHRQEDFEGTGIGLATVRRIVRKHGGRIWAEAALDQGATFYFTLAPPGETGAGSSEPPPRVSEVHDAA